MVPDLNGVISTYMNFRTVLQVFYMVITNYKYYYYPIEFYAWLAQNEFLEDATTKKREDQYFLQYKTKVAKNPTPDFKAHWTAKAAAAR